MQPYTTGVMDMIQWILSPTKCVSYQWWLLEMIYMISVIFQSFLCVSYFSSLSNKSIWSLVFFSEMIVLVSQCLFYIWPHVFFALSRISLWSPKKMVRWKLPNFDDVPKHISALVISERELITPGEEGGERLALVFLDIIEHRRHKAWP